MVNNQQLTFEGAMMIVQGNRWIQLKDIERLTEFIQEQQSTIDKQELRLQCLEELLELSENLNKSYREKLIDMNLKMVIDDE